ncbi:unnamed protein product, partial [Rotaria sordida]
PTIVKRAAIAEISTFALKWKKPLNNNITKEEKQLLNEIKSNNNIIVVSADKGGKTVIMNRNVYIEKIKEKLNDNKLYKIVTDPTNKIKEKINEITDYLFKTGRINEMQKFDFKSIDNLPYVRGQPKLHKDNHPMRIITCTRSTILSSISLFTFNFIKHLRGTINNNVKNTEDFISKLIDIEIDNDDRLASLDVIDLFNNVPISKSIDIVLKRINYV